MSDKNLSLGEANTALNEVVINDYDYHFMLTEGEVNLDGHYTPSELREIANIVERTVI